jgi:hypothetical protein
LLSARLLRIPGQLNVDPKGVHRLEQRFNVVFSRNRFESRRRARESVGSTEIVAPQTLSPQGALQLRGSTLLVFCEGKHLILFDLIARPTHAWNASPIQSAPRLNRSA